MPRSTAAVSGLFRGDRSVMGIVTLHHGDALDVLRTLPDASVHAVVTDPPWYSLPRAVERLRKQLEDRQ
jgi:DNA modification methylase